MKDVSYAVDEEGNRIHPVDQQYKSLGLEETTVLDHSSDEFKWLHDYFTKTHGKTHSQYVVPVFMFTTLKLTYK